MLSLHVENLLLPDGYYGNAFAYSVTITTAGKLIENPLAYALDLVKKAKTNVTKENMQSATDLMVIKGRPYFNKSRLYLVTDVTRAGFRDVEFGWGKPVYGGPAKGGDGANPGLACFHVALKNVKGEEGVLKRWMCLSATLIIQNLVLLILHCNSCFIKFPVITMITEYIL